MNTKTLWYINAAVFLLYVCVAVFLFDYAENKYEVQYIELVLGTIIVLVMSVPVAGLLALITFNKNPYKDRFLLMFLISTAVLFFTLTVLGIYILCLNN